LGPFWSGPFWRWAVLV